MRGNPHGSVGQVCQNCRPRRRSRKGFCAAPGGDVSELTPQWRAWAVELIAEGRFPAAGQIPRCMLIARDENEQPDYGARCDGFVLLAALYVVPSVAGSPSPVAIPQIAHEPEPRPSGRASVRVPQAGSTGVGPPADAELPAAEPIIPCIRFWTSGGRFFICSWAFCISAGLVGWLALALRDGGFDLVGRQETALGLWAVIAIGLMLGLLPLSFPPRPVRIPLYALAGLICWSALALIW